MIQTHPGLDEQAVTVCLEAAKLIGKSLEPDIAIAGILRLLSQRLKLEKGRVVMPNPESGSLHIRYSYGLTEDEKQRGIYALGEGVTGRVITTGKIALIPDVTSEPTYLARVADLKDNNNQNLAYIAVPIVKDDTPIGVLAVHPLQISTFFRN